MVTWWVDYSFTYEYFDTEENAWIEYEDFDAGRFHCLKKHIPGAVTAQVEKDLEGEQYRNLKVKINDSYQTTDVEV